MEDEIRVPCPHCNSILTVDDAGDLVMADDQPVEREGDIGLGGLRVVDADPGWKERSYYSNSGARKAEKGPGARIFGFEHNLGPTPPDPELEAAAAKDLREKNITPKAPKRKPTKKKTDSNDD